MGCYERCLERLILGHQLVHPAPSTEQDLCPLSAALHNSGKHSCPPLPASARTGQGYLCRDRQGWLHVHTAVPVCLGTESSRRGHAGPNMAADRRLLDTGPWPEPQGSPAVPCCPISCVCTESHPSSLGSKIPVVLRGRWGRTQQGLVVSVQPCPLTLQLSEASGPEFTDAHVTWLNFVRRPDHGPSKKRCRGQDKKLVSPRIRAQVGVAVSAPSGASFSPASPSEAFLAPPATQVWRPPRSLHCGSSRTC